MSREDEAPVDFGERAPPDGERRLDTLVWVFPPAMAGRVIVLQHGTTLGRGELCTTRVDGRGVSRWHVVLRREGAVLIARDQASTNGTFVDGRRVTQAGLRHGSVLRIGSCVGVVRIASAASGASSGATGFGPIADGVWGGDELRRAIEPARRAAVSRLPVLLVGEWGTGKEACARAIHAWSERPGSFVVMRGAVDDYPGYFRSAHRGTLLLDELDALPLAGQAALLRALEEHVTALGQTDPVPSDVRVMCASRTPLARAVTAGSVRTDLFMRLKGLQIELPPLRARRADVAPLFQLFLGAASAAVRARVIEALCVYSWPGNVRELQRVAQRLLVLHSNEPRLELEHLPPDVRAAPIAPAGDGGRSDLARLASRLRRNGADLGRACVELGISRQRAYGLLDGRSPRELLAHPSD